MEFLGSLDTQTFFFINRLPHTPWSDIFAQALSGFGVSWILWFIIGVLLFVRKEKKDHWFWLPLFVAAVLCFFLSEVLFKNIVMRSRPDFLTGTIVVGAIPRSYAFPSTHATIAFAFAYLFSRQEVHWAWMYGLAFFVCVSRVYLGHHFPTDVLGGMLLGTTIGMVTMMIDRVLHRTKRAVLGPFSKKKGKQV